MILKAAAKQLRAAVFLPGQALPRKRGPLPLEPRAASLPHPVLRLRYKIGPMPSRMPISFVKRIQLFKMYNKKIAGLDGGQLF